jgi:D-glycero-D-manno-heptose 1,7-bisphosphate phosphatase
MGRYSVDKNMVQQTQTAVQPSSGNLTPLVMPAVFDKYAILLDRDGVLCECSDAITGPSQFKPIDNSFRAVAIIRSKGHKISILFDQPGVAHKKVTIEQVEDCNRYMLNLLGQAGCTSIDGIWYSTTGRKDDPYAKPNLGLFRHAETMVPNLQIKGSVYVGDSLEDLLMADKAGATPVLVLTGNGQKTANKLKNPIYRMLLPKVKVFDNLMTFAESL